MTKAEINGKGQSGFRSESVDCSSMVDQELDLTVFRVDVLLVANINITNRNTTQHQESSLRVLFAGYGKTLSNPLKQYLG